MAMNAYRDIGCNVVLIRSDVVSQSCITVDRTKNIRYYWHRAEQTIPLAKISIRSPRFGLNENVETWGCVSEWQLPVDIIIVNDLFDDRPIGS